MSAARSADKEDCEVAEDESETKAKKTAALEGCRMWAQERLAGLLLFNPQGTRYLIRQSGSLAPADSIHLLDFCVLLLDVFLEIRLLF